MFSREIDDLSIICLIGSKTTCSQPSVKLLVEILEILLKKLIYAFVTAQTVLFSGN